MVEKDKKQRDREDIGGLLEEIGEAAEKVIK